MSGDGGPIGMDPGLRAAAADARAEERAAVLAYAEAQQAAVERMIKRGDCGREEGGLLNDRLRAFASGIATGLHLMGRADG